jgi:hypothetical protein
LASQTAAATLVVTAGRITTANIAVRSANPALAAVASTTVTWATSGGAALAAMATPTAIDVSTAKILRFVGPSASGDNDLVTQGNLLALLPDTVDVPQAQALIDAALAIYADDTYVDTRDALLATSEYIDAADATRLAKANLNKPGFPFTLDSAGKVPVSLAGSLQRYPRTASVVTTGSGSTTSETTIGSLIPVPDPGYNYKLMVTGTVHAQVNRDNGEYPKIVAVRADNTVVGIGYGIAEGYQTPVPDGQSSRIYLTNAVALDANNTWTNLPNWTSVSTGIYTASLSGNGILVNKAMKAATISASIAFTGAAAPLGGATASQIRIVNLSTQAIVATSAAVTSGSGTATVSATFSPLAGQVYGVQALTSNSGPLYNSVLNAGSLATWAAGSTNTLTIAAAIATGQTSADIPIIPQITDQSTIAAGTSTTVSLRIQNPASGGTVSTVNYSPYVWVVPIPA